MGIVQNTALMQPDCAPALLGEILVANGALDPGHLARALEIQTRQDAPLGSILVAQDFIRPSDLLWALSEQTGLQIVDLEAAPPDIPLVLRFGPETCLKHKIIPWKTTDGVLVVAVANPRNIARNPPPILAEQGPYRLVLASEEAIRRQIEIAAGRYFADRANTRCPTEFSCRNAKIRINPFALFVILEVVVFGGLVAPAAILWVICGWMMLYLMAQIVLRVIALAVDFRERRRGPDSPTPPLPRSGKLPQVSILIPLYREAEILPFLIERLARTTYPKELLEFCLVLEEDDTVTKERLKHLDIPRWMRAITVPEASLKTKPRAMNYALAFCKGDIIGIYDAEDAPDTDQIHRIVAKFDQCGPEVACVQAYLDFYNTTQTWLARCFTIEYAIWFRLILQGMERLRLPVPLGGTSVYFRRNVLEEIGLWDAHNVTEDADLGFRLSRLGYRTAFEPSVTHEEANCYLAPWVKQRSRWLKGYAITWLTHMRAPLRLWRDLGTKGFVVFHVLLLGTISSFALAPMLWAFWLIAIGFVPSIYALLPPPVWIGIWTVFFTAEALQALIGIIALSKRGTGDMWPWVFTMPFYLPLGTVAAIKAGHELVRDPYFWDKTTHGLSLNQNAVHHRP